MLCQLWRKCWRSSTPPSTSAASGSTSCAASRVCLESAGGLARARRLIHPEHLAEEQDRLGIHRPMRLSGRMPQRRDDVLGKAEGNPLIVRGLCLGSGHTHKSLLLYLTPKTLTAILSPINAGIYNIFT